LADAEGFRAIAYRSDVDSHTHVAMVLGRPGKKATLVRVHTACFMGDVLGARVCKCGETLRQSLKQIAAAGEGVLVYLDREPKSTSKLSCTHEAAATQEERQRDLGVGSQILRDLGIGKIKLLTNNPSRPLTGIDSFGLTIAEFVAIGSGAAKASAAKAKTR
jgi:3,4-dihydroxy 2-butanone 4-phosphate synthase/GTP cyclohydrolase II